MIAAMTTSDSYSYNYTDSLYYNNGNEYVSPFNGLTVENVSVESEWIDSDFISTSVHATVEGHEAVFFDDGEGHLELAHIDFNDDGEYGVDECFNITDLDATVGDIVIAGNEGSYDDADFFDVAADYFDDDADYFGDDADYFGDDADYFDDGADYFGDAADSFDADADFYGDAEVYCDDSCFIDAYDSNAITSSSASEVYCGNSSFSDADLNPNPMMGYFGMFDGTLFLGYGNDDYRFEVGYNDVDGDGHFSDEELYFDVDINPVAFVCDVVEFLCA